MNQSSDVAIVLAAGRGTRMQSALPKVMQKVANRTMLAHVQRAIAGAGIDRQVVVIAPGQESVEAEALSAPGNISIAIQAEQKGTGHAVMAAQGALGEDAGAVYVVLGDAPLYRAENLRQIRQHLDSCDIVVVGFRPPSPTGYGRLIVDEAGPAAIREEKDASPQEREIELCWSGQIAFSRVQHLVLLDDISPSNAKGEYYLTQIVELARAKGLKIGMVEAPAVDVMGVDTRSGLAIAEAEMQNRLRARALAGGVTMADPLSVYLAADTELGADVVLEPHIVFGPGVRVGAGACIRAFSHLEGATIGANAQIGPFARLRPGANIGAGAKAGNFVEIKNATIGPGAKVNHLSYIGDADVGERANIGAGTITCNYDGFFKYRTEIGAGAFVGSNTALVAPVKIGAGAYVASGSVVTSDVGDAALALARARQVEKPGWAAKFTKRQVRKKSSSSS
ncbi:MAG: bifunctional UDP-N-acetylglucosamine diphosphorylase/glucosamine-1-phosphate N-acetyltransferase GlmU [Alphaproteobacteria bacterium]